MKPIYEKSVIDAHRVPTEFARPLNVPSPKLCEQVRSPDEKAGHTVFKANVTPTTGRGPLPRCLTRNARRT